MNRVRSQSKVMRTFIAHYHDLERSTLEDFANRATAQDTMSIPGLLDRIHLLATGSDDLENFGNVGIFHLLAKNIEVKYGQFCYYYFILINKQFQNQSKRKFDSSNYKYLIKYCFAQPIMFSCFCPN